MVKFGMKKIGGSIRNVMSKGKVSKEDDAATIAAQAAKDAQVQLQMQQFQQWQMQQQQMQMQQQMAMQGQNPQMLAHPDPPTASMRQVNLEIDPVGARGSTLLTAPVTTMTADAAAPEAAVPFPEEAGAGEMLEAAATEAGSVQAPSVHEEEEQEEAQEEEAREEEETQAEEETSLIDEIAQNRDTYEPDEDALANFTTEEEEEEEESLVSEEEEASHAASSVVSYDEETYDGAGTVEHQKSYDGSLAACEAMGNQKKFFHKDVVLHNLNEHNNGNDLVIRAMYFVPKPKSPEDVVVRIEASTVSPRDVMFCRGVGLERRMLPFVPGFEIIGTVQTLGEAARSQGIFKEGQRVAGLSLNGGGNSRFISVPGDRLFHISSTVKSTNAVCLIHDYMAALKALRLAKKAGSPFTGMKMLITDGFSPVGQAIINLANMEGASIYCCADLANHAHLASLGAKCFEKAPESWLPSVSGTFDIVIDNSCVDAYSSSWFALNQRGTLVCLSPIFDFDRPRDVGCGILDFGDLQKKWAGIKAKFIMPNTYFFDTLNDFDGDREQYVQDFRYLTFLLEKGDIKPKIAEKVALEDVPDAQRLMFSGKANGTIVCVPWIEN